LAKGTAKLSFVVLFVVSVTVMWASQVVARGRTTFQDQSQAKSNTEQRKSQTEAGKVDADEAQKLINNSDCKSCHAVDHKVVGPSYTDIAKKYAGQADAPEHLAKSVREGGSGNWGNVPMIPHPNLKDEDLKVILAWILSLKDAAPAPSAGNADAKTYEYKLPDGKSVKLDFPLFVEGSNEKVTKDVFRGYELYDSYCYRCHGQDVTESELAPDLKHSLNSGMAPQEFLSTAMAGREAKGMPSWAGFFTEQEIKDIYIYVKGRSLDLIPVGRPPSEE